MFGFDLSGLAAAGMMILCAVATLFILFAPPRN
jgi:hypothetical protein